MNNRINSLLKHLKLSSAQFADEIGVQRSSVSHVLSGRNKPGFDFIQKILSRFPEISADWLITGAGEMLKRMSQKEFELFETKEEREEEAEKKHNLKKEAINGNLSKGTKNIEKEKDKKRQIEKIIIIYKDKSFEEYNPA